MVSIFHDIAHETLSCIERFISPINEVNYNGSTETC